MKRASGRGGGGGGGRGAQGRGGRGARGGAARAAAAASGSRRGGSRGGRKGARGRGNGSATVAAASAAANDNDDGEGGGEGAGDTGGGGGDLGAEDFDADELEDALLGLHRLEKDPFYAKEIEVEVEAALDLIRSRRARLDMGLIKAACVEEMGPERAASLGGDDELVQAILRATALRLDARGVHRIENLEMFSGTLTELYLQYNCIAKMENLETLTGLRILALHGNRIVRVEGVASLQRLEYLNVSDNQLADLDPDGLPSSLEALDVSGNAALAAPGAGRQRRLGDGGGDSDGDGDGDGDGDEGNSLDPQLQEALILALPELLMLNNRRIQHRFRELFQIVGTSAADSLAAGGTGGAVEDLDAADVPAVAAASAGRALGGAGGGGGGGGGVSASLRERLSRTLKSSAQQLEAAPEAGKQFSSKRDEIFARMQARRGEFAAQQAERHQGNVQKAHALVASRAAAGRGDGGETKDNPGK